MDGDKLVSMANQIASFFQAYSEEEAMRGIRDHIVAFWTPGMRRDLSTRIAQNPEGVAPLVLAAMTQRTQAKSPIGKETQGPGRLGHLASDAG